MKKLFRSFCAGTFMCTLFMCFTACDSASTKGSGTSEEEASIKEYILPNSSQWGNLDYSEDGKILVIDNDADLRKHVWGNYYPPVDFSKKTLLLAYGASSGIGIRKYKLEQISGQSYVMTVDLIQTLLSVYSKWHIALVLDKLPSECKVELNAIVKNLYFNEYSLKETQSGWKNLDDTLAPEGKIIIINSDEELSEYVSGDYPPVDFHITTLLLAYGIADNGVSVSEYGFEQISTSNYVMNVVLQPSPASEETKWVFALTVFKLKEESDVGLNVSINGSGL